MHTDGITDDLPAQGEELLSWARKLKEWLLGGFRKLRPHVPDVELHRDIFRKLRKARGSPAKEERILAGLAESLMAAGFTEPMPVVPQRIREASRDAHVAWLFEGYRQLHPNMSEHELVASMSEAIRRDGWHQTKAKLYSEFKRIGYPAGPTIK